MNNLRKVKENIQSDFHAVKGHAGDVFGAFGKGSPFSKPQKLYQATKFIFLVFAFSQSVQTENITGIVSAGFALGDSVAEIQKAGKERKTYKNDSSSKPLP